MRADAKKNYDHLLAVARAVFTEQGADASLRDVARKADVGLGTCGRTQPPRRNHFDVATGCGSIPTSPLYIELRRRR